MKQMTDYIKREDAVNECFNCWNKDYKTIAKSIKVLPSADVRENVKGKWQPIEVQPYFKKHFDTSVVCSVCHRKGNKLWNFCPNCGADMKGK